MRGFVSAEKERLVQKRQALVKSAEKKDQDSRIASLVEFSQTFKVRFRFVLHTCFPFLDANKFLDFSSLQHQCHQK